MSKLRLFYSAGSPTYGFLRRYSQGGKLDEKGQASQQATFMKTVLLQGCFDTAVAEGVAMHHNIVVMGRQIRLRYGSSNSILNR